MCLILILCMCVLLHVFEGIGFVDLVEKGFIYYIQCFKVCL